MPIAYFGNVLGSSGGKNNHYFDKDQKFKNTQSFQENLFSSSSSKNSDDNADTCVEMSSWFRELRYFLHDLEKFELVFLTFV